MKIFEKIFRNLTQTKVGYRELDLVEKTVLKTQPKSINSLSSKPQTPLESTEEFEQSLFQSQCS